MSNTTTPGSIPLRFAAILTIKDLVSFLNSVMAENPDEAIYAQNTNGEVICAASLERETLSDGSQVLSVVLYPDTDEN